MLLSVLTLAALCDVAAAQSVARNPKPAAKTAPRSTSTAATTKRTAVKRSLTTKHPFYPYNMPKLPAGITTRTFDPTPKGRGVLWAGASKVHRAPGDETVTRQTVLLSKSDPNAEFSTTPATSLNEHPYWSSDEKYIYFDSNRASDTDTTPSTNNIFNVFRMLADGSGIVQMSPNNAQNQLDPNISSDGGTLAYVAGGTIAFTNGLSKPTTTGFDLYTLTINNGGTPTQLTNAGGQFAFSDVRHPSYSPGGDKIAFAGKLKGATTYHIFTLSVSTGVITQMTGGASNDYSPAFSPDGNLIAFTTNASGFGSNAAPSPAAGTVGNDDIYVITPNPVQLHPARVTNFAVGGVQSSNRNPAWSSLKVDPLGNIPPETDANGNALTYSEQLLAFGTTRQDTNKDGIANAVGTTSDIYWLHARIGPVSPGVYTVTTPESAGNVAHKLRTSEPDTAIDPTDPTYNFDPNFVSNEDYPTWPQYQNTYRIAFQSDKGGNLALWGSLIIDIDAPTLLKYDIAGNEIVHVARDSAPDSGLREVNAGETVRFRVRAVDYESGVESVYLQIKCPDSAEQSSDNVEHKVFIANTGNATLNTTAAVVANPYEVDAQAINANATNTSSAVQFKPNGFNSGATGFILGTWPGGNIYTPGVEDQTAFTGLLQLPDDGQYVPLGAAPGTPPPGAPDRDQNGKKVNLGGFWLRLYDDGPVSQGGHEPEGETAGDGVYTAVWQTPPSFPSDWLIDVIVRDMSINPFNPAAAINWKIYDNVWGFTSKPFQAKSGVLYVSDYDTGQKFLGGRFGNFGAGNQGVNFMGLAFNGTPTESWMTEFDPQLFPNAYTPPVPPPPLIHYETTLGANSYGAGGSDALDFDGSPFPPTQHYDIWRIQCRGPIPNAVLNTYAPHLETQAFDPISGTTPPPVLVAERCVIWHAPYLGDLFVGPGTLLDPSVQAQLQAFVAGGGRLMVQGQDVAWGLTLGGSTGNAFLNNTLHVAYSSDDVFLTAPGDLSPDQINVTAADPAGNARGGVPIGWETWYLPLGHPDYPGPPGNPPDYPPGKANMFMGDLPTVAGHDFNCPNVGDGIGTPDVVTFPAAQTGVNGIDATFNNTAKSPAIMWWTDATAQSKVVFSPIGWEAICSEYYAAGTSFVLLNRKTELMHNTLDYLRTGRLIGTVRVINPNGSASSPLGGAVVRAISSQTGAVVASTKTLSDGSYVLNGLYPSGIYGLDAVKKGYVTQHSTGGAFHGAYQNKQDFFMTQAQPGGASGVITVFGTGAPVGGAIVTAVDNSDPTDPNPPSFSSQPSDPKDGSYTINNLPASTYTLTVTNLAAIGYASSVPPSIKITVSSSSITTGANFQLKQLPGRVLGKVDIADAKGNDTGVPLPGAVVTATGKTIGTAPAEVFTSPKTAADGTFTIPGIDPGLYTLVATAPGYAPNNPINVTVSSNSDTTGIVIALVQIPPGGVTGLISTSTGNTVDGATVTVTDAAGTNYTATSFNPPQTGTDANGNSYQYNYLVPKVAAGGNVTVTATKAGYTPTPNPDTQTVAVAAGTTTTGVNFTLNPLFSYDADLSLVSAPFQWTVNGQPLDVATLLMVPAADVASGAFAFITWDGTAQKYVYHPTPPADTFHLGVGYFMQDSALGASGSLPLTNPNGTTAPQDASGNYLPFNIPLQTGWNMIGDPFPFSVDLSKLQINDGGNLVNVPDAQTGGNPALGAALWTYEHGAYEVVYTLDPYRGYWLHAFRPVTLVVSASAQQGRGVGSQTTRALVFGNNKSSDWKLQLMAQAGKRVAGNSYLGTNRAAQDKYDQYKMLTPPSVNPQDVSVVFNHTDWGNKSGNYSVDVRSPSAASWDFTVNSSIPNTPVTLTWPNLATTGRRDMTLTDLDTGTTFELHNRSSYVIPTGNTPISHHFRLAVTRATRAMLQLTNVDAEQSMPTKGVGAAAANIRYTLTADATVQIRVLNSNGRAIRTLEPGTTRAAGDNNAIWDLKNDRGVTVPASVYTVEVRAVDANGHMVRQPRTLVITR
jgi:Tol biopolymer transport system component